MNKQKELDIAIMIVGVIDGEPRDEAIVALTHVLVATCDEYGIDTMRLVMDCVKKQARINGENEL